MCDLLITIALGVTSFIFPNCTEELGIYNLKIRMTSRSCNKYEQITLSYLLSVK